MYALLLNEGVDVFETVTEEEMAEDERATSELAKELEGVRLSNEEFQTRLEDVQAHERKLTESLHDREQRISELTTELDTVHKEASDLALRLQMTEVSLENTKSAAENEGLRALRTTVASLEARVSELEQQRSGKRSKLHPRHKLATGVKDGSIVDKLHCWLRLSH